VAKQESRMFDLALIGFGPVEAIVVVIVVLVVFGAGRLAGVGKALGTGLREFREEARTSDSETDEDDGDEEVVAQRSDEGGESKSS
jgi:sec-independent protein translocase protein TatA